MWKITFLNVVLLRRTKYITTRKRSVSELLAVFIKYENKKHFRLNWLPGNLTNTKSMTNRNILKIATGVWYRVLCAGFRTWGCERVNQPLGVLFPLPVLFPPFPSPSLNADPLNLARESGGALQAPSASSSVVKICSVKVQSRFQKAVLLPARWGVYARKSLDQIFQTAVISEYVSKFG